MRLLIDECLFRQIVARLRDDGHDVSWVRLECPGAGDDEVLAKSVAEDRIVVTEDRDFGELTVRFKLPSVGIVIVAVGEFAMTLDQVANHVAQAINGLGDSCRKCITVIEPGRIRQRRL